MLLLSHEAKRLFVAGGVK